MSFEFMTPAGYESYSYNWSENVALDGTQPLTILNHVGGDPLLFFAARGKNQPENYDLFVKWVKKGFGYAETLAMQEVPEEDREMLMNLKNEMMPLVERFDTATRQLMIPAFADSQGALVIDAKSTSTAWHAFMPVSDQPLPLPEVALVYGVSDAAQAKAAFSEYFAITQDLLTKLHEASTGDYAELFDEEIPLIELPKPLERAEGSGTVYYYTLPQTTGLDPQIAPNAGLSDDVMAMSLLPKFTARLMNETPVINSGPLADVNRPLAAAGHLNFAGFIDMISPWVDYGMMMAGALQASEGAQPDQMAMVMEHVKVGMEVLRCFRGVSSVTYIEDGVTVSHSEWRFQDLP